MELLNKPPLLFRLKIAYFYVIDVAYFESDIGFHVRRLVWEIFIFPRIKITCIFERFPYIGDVVLLYYYKKSTMNYILNIITKDAYCSRKLRKYNLQNKIFLHY